MGLSPSEAFRLGFLTRCAEEGLSLDGVRDRVKQATLGKTALGYTGYQAGKDVGSVVGELAALPATLAMLGIPAAALIGGAGGYGLGRLTSDHEVDAKQIKQQELAQFLRQQAQIARTRMATRTRPATVPRGPRLLAQ